MCAFVISCNYIVYLERSRDKSKGTVFPVQAIKAYGDDRVYLHSFLMATVDGGEWSAHCSCITPGEGTPPNYPLNRRLAGATEPVWTFWRREKSPASARIRTQNHPEHSLVTILTS